MGGPIGSIQSADGAHLLIGVDPGSTTGVSVVTVDNPRQIKALYTMDFWSLFNLLNMQKDTLTRICQIYIEQPSLIKAMYGRHSKATNAQRVAWNVGSNAREGILLRDGLRNLGYTVFDVRPVGRKKWTSEDFQAATGYPDHSNQHVRDATFLIWDKVWLDTSQI